MSALMHADLPHFVSFGEALTDFVRVGRDRWRSSSGGAPWNLACAMSSLGQLSAFGGAISQDVFGQAIWQASQDANLDMRFIQQLPKPPLLAMVHEVDPPRYLFIGDDSADLHFRPEGLPAGWLRPLRWAHFGSLSLVRQPLGARLLALAEGLKAEGKKISFDPNYRSPPMDASYDETLEQMCRLADLIKVSDEDLCGLFRVSDYRSGLAQIAAWNPSAWLLLTRGALGATLFRGVEECRASPPLIEVVDTVGAGDSALAGLLDSLMSRPDAPLSQHLARSMAAGAAACLSMGFSPPRPSQVEALLGQVELR